MRRLLGRARLRTLRPRRRRRRPLHGRDRPRAAARRWRLAKSVDGVSCAATRADGAGGFGFRFVSEIDVAGAAGGWRCRARPTSSRSGTSLRGGRNSPPRLADRAVGAGDPQAAVAGAAPPCGCTRRCTTAERDRFVCYTASPPTFPRATRGTRRARATSRRCGWASAASCRCPRRSPACRGRRPHRDAHRPQPGALLRGLGGHLPQWSSTPCWRSCRGCGDGAPAARRHGRRQRAGAPPPRRRAADAQIRRAQAPAVPPREGTMTPGVL